MSVPEVDERTRSNVLSDWHCSLAAAIRDTSELLDELRLKDFAVRVSPDAAEAFALMVPRSFLARMRPGDPDDPLLRQVLPLDDELRPVAGFDLDAVSDAEFRKAPGLLHKYHGWTLLIAAEMSVRRLSRTSFFVSSISLKKSVIKLIHFHCSLFAAASLPKLGINKIPILPVHG